MKTLCLSLLAAHLAFTAVAQSNLASTSAPRAKTTNGSVEGTTEASGIRSFKGIPFAQPPVGDLRWKEPQPVKNWTDVRSTKKFGPRAMQRAVFGDMGFRSDGMSEDCLYLNVWTPANRRMKGYPYWFIFTGGALWPATAQNPATTAKVWPAKAL